MNQFQATENELETGADLSQTLRQSEVGFGGVGLGFFLFFFFLLTA